MITLIALTIFSCIFLPLIGCALIDARQHREWVADCKRRDASASRKEA